MSKGVSRAKFEAHVKTEKSYCAANVEDVNCNCFAHKAAYVMAQTDPQVIGLEYADRQDMARNQAGQTC